MVNGYFFHYGKDKNNIELVHEKENYMIKFLTFSRSLKSSMWGRIFPSGFYCHYSTQWVQELL